MCCCLRAQEALLEERARKQEASLQKVVAECTFKPKLAPGVRQHPLSLCPCSPEARVDGPVVVAVFCLYV